MRIIKTTGNTFKKVNFFGFTVATLEFGTFYNHTYESFPHIFKTKYDDTVYGARIKDKSGTTFFTDKTHAIMDFFDLPSYFFFGD
jgi:hypothetical protein